MKLSADVLLRAENYLNSWRDRELNLRGLKLPAIENLAALQDQFDCIDFSDNEIRKLGNFPMMKRLTTILANNNYISRIDTRLGTNIAEITSLILTNNRISSLSEIDHIATCTKLEHLSLMDNPIVLKTNYRLYTIYKLKHLKSLDFKKIQVKERDTATKYFKSLLGKAFLSEINNEGKSISELNEESSNGGNGSSSSEQIHINGNGIVTNGSIGESNTSGQVSTPMVLTEEQKQLVREAIEKATTKDEIDLIEKRLKSGTFFELLKDSSTEENMSV